MKTSSLPILALAGLVAFGGPQIRADEVIAKVNLNGNLINRATKQSFRGTFRGTGEYTRIDLDVNVRGTVLSQPNTRDPRPTLMGRYPVEVDMRAFRSGVSLSESFNTNLVVMRKRIRVSDVGTIFLDRPVNPRKVGYQRVRGRGTLRYDF